MKLICFGTSITEGRTVSDPPEPFIFVHPEEAQWPHILEDLFRKEGIKDIKVINRGVGGNTTKDALARLETDVLAELPATVIIEFGFNDAIGMVSPESNVSVQDFRQNLAEIIKSIRARGGSPICVVVNHPTKFIHPQSNKRPLEENMAPYQEVLKQARGLGADHILEVFSNWNMFPVENEMSWDGLHLKENGNRHYARILAALLVKAGAVKKD